MSKLTIEEVMMYKISPRWGKGPYRVVAVKCMRKGKTLFVPQRVNRYIDRSQLFDTPNAAVKARIAEEVEEQKAQATYLKNMTDTVKQLKELL